MLFMVEKRTIRLSQGTQGFTEKLPYLKQSSVYLRVLRLPVGTCLPTGRYR